MLSRAQNSKQSSMQNTTTHINGVKQLKYKEKRESFEENSYSTQLYQNYNANKNQSPPQFILSPNQVMFTSPHQDQSFTTQKQTKQQ